MSIKGHRGPTAPFVFMTRLRRQGRRHSPKRVARIMAERGRGRRVGARNGGEANGRAASGPDLVGRDFTADASNQRRVADISRVRLCRREALPGRDPRPYDRGRGPLDGATRRTTSGLVVNALFMALVRSTRSGTSSSRRPWRLGRARRSVDRRGGDPVVGADRGVRGQRRDQTNMGNGETRGPSHPR